MPRKKREETKVKKPSQQKLDPWLVISRFIPWKGPVMEIFENVRRELPEADPLLTLFSSFAAFSYFVNGEIPGIGGGMFKLTVNVGVVGPPGTGKTTVVHHVFWRLNSTGVVKVNIASSRASVEGLGRLLESGEAVAHICDEVQQILRARGNQYLSHITDFWKTAFYRVPFVFPRSDPRKSIHVPADARLVVVWTTTYEDLEHVLEKLNPALMRRFIILTVDRDVDPWVVGEELEEEWKRVAEELAFAHEFRWSFQVVIPEEVKALREKLCSTAHDPTYARKLLSEYGLRLACLLSLDRLINYLRQSLSSHQQWGSLHESLKSEFNRLIQTEGVTPEVTTPNRSELEKIKYFNKEFSNIILNILLKIVDEQCRSKSKGFSRGFPAPLNLSGLLVELTRLPWPIPRVLDLRRDTVTLEVPYPYLALGLLITYWSLLSSEPVREWVGFDPRFAYFLRKLRELKEKKERGKIKHITLRTMAQYMRKFGSYRELMDVIARAVAAGYLKPLGVSDLSEVTGSTRFRVKI